MAQHDYNIANQSGADFRADLNNALLAIATVNSGATEPSTTFAHQLWVDTASSVLKIRNAADNAWITTGVSITASNTFTGDLTGNVTGNLTGNVTGNVTGDLTGNADSADILSTARTISLSGDVVGSASFDGSANIDIDTVVQINSITLGTDTTGDYVESLSGGTGVTVTGGTGEGSTPSIAIGQAVATTDDVTFNTITATDEFIGDLDGAVRFSAKAGEALTKGDLVYVSGVSGDVPVVSKAKADDASKMPVFGLAVTNANNNAELQVATFGTLDGLNTSGVSEGQILYASTTAGAYTTTKPTGESSQIQNIGKVIRSHAAAGSIKIGGAGRSNDVPNLNNGKIFIGNASNQAVTTTLDTSIVVENTNLYYTTTRANTDFDTRLATKDTGDLTEGSNLYYTTARVNSDFDTRLATKDTGDLTEGVNLYYTDARVNSAFDTRLATKDTGDLTEGSNLYYTTARVNSDFDTRLATKSTTDLAEGTNLYYTSARFDSAFTSKDTDDLSEGTTNLYYTTARFDSAFGNKTTSDLTEGTNLYYTDTRANSAIDTRVTKAFVDALGIQASSVDANSVTLGTDTVGNYVATVTGTANKITVTGSGSESANITLSLPDDVQIADSLTVAGNLTVNGTLTSLDTTNLDIEDNLFQLNAGLTGSPVNDSGMLINRGTADNGIFMWDESVDKFTLGLTTADGTATGNITLNSLGTLVANLEGAVTGTVSSLSNHDTGDLTEGSNLYYTDARSRNAISATGDISYNSSTGVISFTQTTAPVTSVNTLTGAVILDTDDVGEGTTNLYFTNARADTRINLQTGTNLDLSSKSTSDLTEGSNLYYTDARVQAVSINNVVEDTTPQLGGDLASNGNDILFADNDKAVFGASSDLQIYHDGTFSHIKDNGTGNLYIAGDNEIIITDAAENEYKARFTTNGSVQLYYDNQEKLATTSTGIDVTGTVTADGLTVDTSTLVVDSTNNRVGIGTSSPQTDLNIVNTSGATLDINTNLAGADSKILLHEGTSASPANGASIRYDGANNLFKIGVGSSVDTTRLTIARDTGIVSLSAGIDVNGTIKLDGNYPVGTENVALGNAALDSLTTGGYNTVIGSDSGADITEGSYNTAIGRKSLFQVTTGDSNNALGVNSLYALTTGTQNVALGVNAMTNTTTASNNVAIGHAALTANTTGAENTAVGANVLDANTTGTDNTAIGFASLGNNTTASRNTAVGNVALNENTTGADNTAVGKSALEKNTTASNNTAFGSSALAVNTTGGQNTAVGSLALDANTTANNNNAFGYSALGANTTGSANNAFGSFALASNTTPNHNSAFGSSALTDNTTGAGNTALGSNAMLVNTTGANNVAVGYLALDANTTASDNTAVGKSALGANTTASGNTAVGYNSLLSATTGGNNTAIGSGAATAITTGNSNVAIGGGAMSSATSDDRAVAIGVNALATMNNTIIEDNYNIGIGYQAGFGITNGYWNTIVGGGAALNLTTGHNNLVIGKDAGVTGSPGGNLVTNNDVIALGDENIANAHIQVDWTVASDQRDKTDFTALDLGLDFVKALSPVTYKWDKRSKYGDKYADDYDLNAQTPDGTHKEDWLDVGFKAQEVEALEIAAGYNKDNNTNLTTTISNDGKQYGLQYTKFIPILVKAIQEQQTIIDDLKSRIETLEG